VAGLARDATRVLDEWAAELRARVAVPVATRILIGAPAAQALIALDSDVTFDLVVVGSHGRTGLGRLVIGSVAEQLVRHAPCPVLVARARPAIAAAI
jgi:universal stress protein A